MRRDQSGAERGGGVSLLPSDREDAALLCQTDELRDDGVLLQEVKAERRRAQLSLHKQSTQTRGNQRRETSLML